MSPANKVRPDDRIKLTDRDDNPDVKAGLMRLKTLVLFAAAGLAVCIFS